MSIEVLPCAGRRAYPPRVTATTAPFWNGLAEGRFQSTYCEDCDRFTFPPKAICPHCWSRRIIWRELSGRGRLYASTVIHAAPAAFQGDAPYSIAIVDLEEGVRLATRLLDKETIELDQPVKLVALCYEDGPLFAARPDITHAGSTPDAG
ncbi:Zn-ribbon domain-containing OB-fold protein [Roseomonas gilardii]|uniref:Zn-ribbon domain-containing OB-fold protein n=1 Tax=Roseomonas gilardii TaxID=257708 RepID=UPI0009516E9F|nr:Zn-ribbon domain-containing OB-fold protein [Roseomonas gilardii]